jgi:hypothetical protein
MKELEPRNARSKYSVLWFQDLARCLGSCKCWTATIPSRIQVWITMTFSRVIWNRGSIQIVQGSGRSGCLSLIQNGGRIGNIWPLLRLAANKATKNHHLYHHPRFHLLSLFVTPVPSSLLRAPHYSKDLVSKFPSAILPLASSFWQTWSGDSRSMLRVYLKHLQQEAKRNKLEASLAGCW